MTIYIKIGEDLIDASTVTPPDKKWRDAWVWNDPNIELDHDKMVTIIQGMLSVAMYDRIEQGVIWQYNNADSPHPVIITSKLRLFLSDTQAVISHPTLARPNAHDGIFFQDGAEFTIDGEGMVELAVFAHSWGLKISQKRNTLVGLLSGLTTQELAAYFDTPVDWSVTWEAADIANGWADATLTQLP